MRKLQLFIMERIKLLALILCFVMAVPKLHAAIVVAGDNTSLFGASWSANANASNEMTRYGSSNDYYLAKPNVTLSGTTQYKVVDNGSWYPSGNNLSFTANGTNSLVFVYNNSSHNVTLYGTFNVVVAGNDTQALGSSWSGTDSNNGMTTCDAYTLKLTRTVNYTASGNKEFKVVHNGNTWYGTSAGGNMSYNIPSAGEYDITYTFNVISKEVNVIVTPKSVTPVTPTYYITGDNGLGLGGFKYDPTTTMTDEGNGIYTYSYNVTTAGNYYFAFGDGQGSDWNDFNGNHRIGPTSGNEEVSLDGSWVNTQKGGGSYFVNVDAGPVTITLDVTNMRFNVVGTAPSTPVDYYVVGGDTNIFPNGWNTGSENLMSENNGTYTWTASNVHLDAGTTYSFKVLGSDNSWHPSGNNATFTVDDSGSYNVVFTFDGTNVTAVPSLIQADPVYTYDIYVRYTGSEPVSNVFLYAWDNGGTLSDAWSGTALSSLTTQEINGFTYYKVSYTSYNSTINVIFNENGTSQTADLTANPGDNYFTYGGGSDVDGPSSQADVPNYYVVGEDTNVFPNGWDIGAETLMTEDNGIYTWTASDVQLDANTDYLYKVHGTNDSWHPDGENGTFNVDARGTYNVVFTFDGTNVTAVPTLIQADPVYTYDIYVRYTGNENISNVFLYAWDNDGTLSDAWNGSTGGTALSSLATEEINGFTYYKVSYTSYDSSIGVIFNENGSASTQTATLTTLPGDNYFTYGGGSDVVGPSSQADVPDYYVVGEDTNIFPNGWDISSETLMTEDNGTYIWTASNVHLDINSYAYKVRGTDGTWYPAGEDNATFDVDARGTYNVVFTFDGTNVTAVPTLVQADPVYTYDIYVRYKGNEPIENVNIYAWDSVGDLSAGWGGTALSSLATEEINGFTYYKVSYTTYTSNINVIFNENGSSSTQTATLTTLPGDNYFTYGGGSDVVGPSSQADVPDYYVVGEDTNIFPNGWDISSETLMTEDNGTYTWTASNVHLDINSYAYKVRGTDGTWYPAGEDNATFDVDARGTYNVVFTFDGTNVTAVPTLIQADPVYTYDIYVRYTGNENISNVFLYAWDNDGTLSDAWNGSTGGTALSSLTTEVINGYTYYKVTYTSYDSSIGVIFNENGSSSTQTGNLTAQPGDNYFTYGGGSTVDGPNDEPDEALASIYVIGNVGSQQWAANAGIAMEYDSETSYYKLENVVLTANSYFAFATMLGNNSDDWATLNANRYNSTGDWNFNITEAYIGQWLNTRPYQDDDHNWYVEKSGAYDIFFNPSTNQVMLNKSHTNLYMSYGVNWSYENNSVEMTSVDGNIYQTTITLTEGDYFLFSTALSDATAIGAETQGYEITNLMIGFAQKLQNENPNNTNNFHFTGTTGKYIVVVNLEKMTVTLRKTADATVTKIYLQKTPNVTLNPAGGTYNGQTLEGKRGGIYAWNKLNLKDAGDTYMVGSDGPTNYTYDGEVMFGTEPYEGNGKLKDLNDTITADGKQWYAWSVSNSICEFYFIRNNKTDYKSQKIMRRAGEVWLIWVDEDATEDRQEDAQHYDKLQDVTALYYDVTASGVSDCSTMLEDHYYVYYTNTTAWDSVYCYAWFEGDPVIEFTDQYPGNKCTFVGYDEDGYEVWCYDFGLMEDFHRIWGTDDNGDYVIPSNVIFDNGLNEDHTRQQTGDLVFDNGACYDYLGMVYLGNSLNGIINTGIVNGPKYTVEDNLMGVYYDEDAITEIMETDMAGNPILDSQGNPLFIPVRGALYAKDFDNYSSKSIKPSGAVDYVYDVCAHPKSQTYPGGSQIQIKRESYDQSNWVKIVLSPNFDNAHLQNTDVTYDHEEFDNENFNHINLQNPEYLQQYVGKIIPGGSMSGNLVDNVNPEMHITNIAKPLATEAYEKNVYVTSHFNDSVVFNYVHQDWSPGIYKGVYRTVPVWVTDEESGQTFVDHMRIDDEPTKLFYVAPKPQEVAFITWAVFVHPDSNVGTNACTEEPENPGEFHAPMNWDRTGQLWDGKEPLDTTGAPYGTTYGPISNGYEQYAAFQINWSLYEDISKPSNVSNRSQLPWYQVFKPGQAYKFLAIIRYAHSDDPNDPHYQRYTAGVYGGGEEYNDGPGDHVANAPRRESETRWPDMQPTAYKRLDQSKFIVFPLQGSGADSNGDGMGNVTAVKEIKYVPTSKDIVNVRYYNMTGIASDTPFDGFNIVVTTYSDGSRTSKKILR